MKKAFLFFMFLLLVTCSDNDFKDYNLLEEAKILAIVADTPEIDGTQTSDVSVVLTPYISDFVGEGQVITVNVISCLDPGIGQGADLECLAPKDEIYPNGGTFDTNLLASTSYTGAMDSITVLIENPSALIAPYSEQQKHNGINYVFIFEFIVGEVTLSAIKSIAITTRNDLNTNPQIDAILYDDGNGEVPLTAPPEGSGRLSFRALNAPEIYQEMNVDNSLQEVSETYFMRWFYTSGSANPEQILEDGDSDFSEDNSDPIALVGVLRDGRGGTDVLVLSP